MDEDRRAVDIDDNDTDRVLEERFQFRATGPALAIQVISHKACPFITLSGEPVIVVVYHMGIHLEAFFYLPHEGPAYLFKATRRIRRRLRAQLDPQRFPAELRIWCYRGSPSMQQTMALFNQNTANAMDSHSRELPDLPGHRDASPIADQLIVHLNQEDLWQLIRSLPLEELKAKGWTGVRITADDETCAIVIP